MSTQRKIYIADDEKNIRVAIKTFLENAGFLVEAFENGDLLLEAFLETPADLVILDVMMPGSNGFVICKELRKISSLPILMLTARDSDLDYVTGLDLGSDDYLTKPFKPSALVMRIKAIFRRMEYDRQVFNERDAMTGIYNRFSGINLVENELKISDKQLTHALFLIDIDEFESINKHLGNEVGDQVIVEISTAISNIFRDVDVVYRLGSDEFIVFAKNVQDAPVITQKAEDLCNALRRSYGEGENQCNISASIGIACFPKHGGSYEELFGCARTALAGIKEKGKDGYRLYQGKHEKG